MAEKDEEVQRDAAAENDQAAEERKADLLEELKQVLPKPYADYVPDMPWERR
ncbi:MAG TPA: hypothetical protein VN758_00500 [Solirubrobacterales bacterium]|nr:hypothetical protein [Solirubrobacterales bacterium]